MADGTTLLYLYVSSLWADEVEIVNYIHRWFLVGVATTELRNRVSQYNNNSMCPTARSIPTAIDNNTILSPFAAHNYKLNGCTAVTAVRYAHSEPTQQCTTLPRFADWQFWTSNKTAIYLINELQNNQNSHQS
jgi:hypothetical protein